MNQGVRDLLSAGELWVGAGAGVVGLLFLAGGVVRTWGAALAAAVTAGLMITDGLGPGATLAVAVLAAAGWLSRGRGPVTWTAAAVPGALLVGASLPDGLPRWMPMAVVIGTVVSAAALASFGARYPTTPLPGLLLPITAVGIYLTTPDTERVLVLLGATATLALVALVGRPTRITPAPAFAIAGLVLWISASDSRGRPASFLPAAACLGLLVAEPLGRALMFAVTRRPAPVRSRVAAALGVALHGGLALWIVRGPTQWSDTWNAGGAALAALACIAVVAGLAVVLLRSRDEAA
jgi:hypothetical protein